MKITKGFEVEWCLDVPYNAETESHEFDCADYRCKDFIKEADAMAYARLVAKKDFWSTAMVKEFVLDEFGQKEYLRDSVEVEA